MDDQLRNGDPLERDPGGAEFVPLGSLQPARKRFDLELIRKRLAETKGRQYWRSLDELAGSDEFARYLQQEFPLQAPRDMSPINRREFFRVMGATLALAGVAGCSSQPAERIVPYVYQPEALIPGKPLYFATAFQRSGFAYGILAESQMGRPTKLEGNSQHPASLGGTDIFMQASLLSLYDPDRSQAVRRMGNVTTWERFLGEITGKLADLRAAGGAGLRLVIGATTSPTMTSQMRRLLAMYPGARVCLHEPVSRDAVYAGGRSSFGEDVNPVYHVDRAQVIVALDSDFLYDEPGSVRYARDFIKGRRVAGGRKTMSRLYAVESTPTLTGANADHRLNLRPGDVEGFARTLAAVLGAGGGQSAPAGVPAQWIPALVKDLQAHRGASLVLAGPYASPALHALAHQMNQTLGNAGKTVTFTAPVEARFPGRELTLAELVSDLRSNRVDTLVFVGTNPVYSAPADVELGKALETFSTPQAARPNGAAPPVSVHLGLYDDETGVLCQWHIPQSHYLEAWSDARAYDGTVSIVQPLIQPLYSTVSAHELLSVLLGETNHTSYDIVRRYWMGQRGGAAVAGAGGTPTGQAGGTAGRASAAATAAAAAEGGSGVAGGLVFTPGGAELSSPPSQAPPVNAAFERFWNQALVAGLVPNSAAATRTVAYRGAGGGAAGEMTGPPAPPPASAPGGSAGGGGMDLILRPDPTIWDGSFANNGWLQECPKPLSKLTWDNAALIGPGTASQNQISNGDLLELSYRGKKLTAAAWILPGHPDGAVTLTLGYGRARAGNVGTGTGFNAYALRTSDAPWGGGGLQIRKSGGEYQLVSTEAQWNMDQHGRDLARHGTLEELVRNPKEPEFMHHEEHADREELPSLFPQMWPSDKQVPAGAPKPGEVGSYPAAGYDERPVPAWGMVIDMTACIGCNACTIGCQAENNIATVGKDQVAMHRTMHWIRVDLYREGDPAHPDSVFQPVPCMHCEKAPCEPVCPVEATTHSAEGINEMTYNRCVGTRYCSNNCPYKVRRFNYFQYTDQQTPSIQLMRNPDVTVRSRGVMEKCTYCVQRVNEARMQAEKEERLIRDGDVVTACEQACPTRAITFGNINDTYSNGNKGSRVRNLKQDPLDFTMLEELNTRPRTSYLARVKNPNPEISPAPASGPAEPNTGG